MPHNTVHGSPRYLTFEMRYRCEAQNRLCLHREV